MERRTTLVAERLRQFTRLGECDSDGKVSLSKEVATILEDLCGEAADMIIAMREQIEKGTVITSDPVYPPFGSIGDSVDIEDELRKFSTSPYQGTAGTINAQLNQQYCGQRLPCGICRMTMMQCPMHVQQYEVTCSSQTGTTGDTHGAGKR